VIRRGAGGDTFLRLIAAERALRGLLMLAAGVYLVSHTGTNFGSSANRLARSLELDPQRPFIRHLIARLGKLRHHQVRVFGIGFLCTQPSSSSRVSDCGCGSAGRSG
jgi:hypothetical protein